MKEMLNILIVDDEINVIKALKRILLFEGFKVDFTIKAMDALEMLQQNRYDLIICDQKMPELSGTEVLEYASNITPNTIRILLTANADIKVLEDAINKCKIHYYIQKPWEINTLIEIIKKVVHEKKIKNHNENFNRTDVIAVKKDDSMIFIKPDEIYYLAASEGKVIIITKDEKYYSWDPLKVWEIKLRNNGFFRCHRGYLVNVDKIKSITPWLKDTYNLKLKDISEEIYISKGYLSSLKNFINVFE